jgi:hypothetical protein
MNTHTYHDPHTGSDIDERAVPVRDAETGSRAWRRVVHVQRSSCPDHSDFYALAGEMVDTLRALDSLTGLLARQTADYPACVTRAGGQLYDDENANPVHRLRSAVLALAETRQALSGAERAANRYWSAISHIGIDHPAPQAAPGGGEPR